MLVTPSSDSNFFDQSSTSVDTNTIRTQLSSGPYIVPPHLAFHIVLYSHWSFSARSDQYRRLQWPLARILKLYPGRDRKERVALVKTQEGEYVRPVQRLYKLEMDKYIANEIKTSSRGRLWSWREIITTATGTKTSNTFPFCLMLKASAQRKQLRRQTTNILNQIEPMLTEPNPNMTVILAQLDYINEIRLTLDDLDKQIMNVLYDAALTEDQMDAEFDKALEYKTKVMIF
ncbi:hypothetical protein LAZ67_X002351 [Cordylochernes scorpioides]|uniref:DUF5641 domain-containing protein n=1 Tax=Cordylochernes scorpioides TaxID=51811 RepID=A0ABY6LWI2_9ARAC|nr:hypothetical protein LAZ67_X002351 [Cordylochernes scorpioides]